MKQISSNVDLCDSGRCKRVRMGEDFHKKHIFTNDYLKKLNKIKLGVTIVSILLMSFIVLIHIPSGIDLDDKDKWTISIITLFGMVSILVGVTNLTKKDQQLQTSSLFKVFELLASPDMRLSRKNIHDKFHTFKTDQKKIFSKTSLEKDADIVLSSFDQVSATVLNGLLDKDLFFDTYGEMIVRDWNALKDEIEFRQSKNKKTLRHFTLLKNEFDEMFRKYSKFKDSDLEPY